MQTRYLSIMFGMSNPAQTLMQIERYIQDGRMEISEVMASEFTSMLLADKKRAIDSQVMLVKGLRLYCDVLLLRDKALEGIPIVKILHKERKKLIRILKNNAPEMISKLTPPAEDYRRGGNLLAAAGKKGPAIKSYLTCQKLAPNHVAAAYESVAALGPEKKMLQVLLKCCAAAGPVIRSGGVFLLQPENGSSQDAKQILATMQVLSGVHNSQKDAVYSLAQRLEQEIIAIEKGEAVANAKLQSALDSLKPKHDYYEYG
jgi:hypothetical protein